MKHRLVSALALTALVTVIPSLTLSAQQTFVAGHVVDRRGDIPVASATVRVDGSTSTTATDARGGFRLPVSEGVVTLRVTRIGFLPSTIVARAGDERLEIRLDAKAIDLDAVVVTGQSGETEMRALGNAVGRINVSDVVRRAPPPKLQDMLSVNVPGLRIMSTSGSVGVGGTTRIRGAGSLTLSNEPLIYVDGVRIDNSNTATGAAYGRGGLYFGTKIGFQWDVPSRINDLNPEEIESIEVIKGPAAAALYGTEAANGVIQIITKRGTAGGSTWDARLSTGANWLHDPAHRWSPVWFVNDAGTLQEFNVVQYNRDLGFPDVFQTGHPAGVGLSFGGRTDAVSYFASGDLNRDEGIVPYNWQNKFNGRGNLSYTHGTLRADVNYGMVRSRTRTAAGAFPITAGIVWPCRYPNCDDVAKDTTLKGIWAGSRTPDAYEAVGAYDDIDRTTTGARFTHQVLPWLNHRVQIGADIGSNVSENLFPRDPTSPFPSRNSQGYRAISTLRTTYYTGEWSATATWSVRSSLQSQLSSAAQYYQKSNHFVTALGTKFALPGSSDISGALDRESSEDYIENKTLGVYVQEQVSWKNRVFLTAALRGDDNSAFGANYDFVTYPKFSAAWIVSEEPAFVDRLPAIETLKLRAAYGRAGQQPDAFAAVRQYRAVTGYAGEGGVTPAVVGNPALKPEVGSEVELGFDAAIWNQRASLELTYYNKKTNDVILAAPLRPSTGFPGRRLINSGQTQNSGFELAIGSTPLNTNNLVWTVRGTLATNDSRVNRLLPGVSNLSVGEITKQYNVVGFAPYSYFYKRVVGSNILTEPDTARWQVMCEGGSAFTRGNGTAVPCTQANQLYYGRPTPSWSGSVSTEITMFRDFQLFALVDMVGGNSIGSGDVYFAHEEDFTSRQAAAAKAVMDSIRTNGSLAGTDGLAAGVDPRVAGLILLNEGTDDGFAGSSGILRNGFARLRTVSASYTFSDRIAGLLNASRGSVTLAAHNLAMLWREQGASFGRKLVDPEIGQNNNANGLALYQQERWPQSTRLSVVLRLSY